MKTLVLFLLLLFAPLAKAQSCVGTWITIDDETGKKKSKVEIYKKDGKLYGKIVYLYPREGREPDPKCTKCPGDRKNEPIVGLQIIRSLNWDGEEWEDGTILDPENGKIYTCTIWLDEDNSDKLHVRGYVGIFYRTQTWVRVKGD